MSIIYVCNDCSRPIIPPHGKPFGNGDGKTRCAACAVDFYMRQPGAGVTFKGESLYTHAETRRHTEK